MKVSAALSGITVGIPFWINPYDVFLDAAAEASHPTSAHNDTIKKYA